MRRAPYARIAQHITDSESGEEESEEDALFSDEEAPQEQQISEEEDSDRDVVEEDGEETEDDDPLEEEDKEEELNSNETHIHHQQRDGSNIILTLSDPDVFDCPICYEPLTIPVFQCDQNGHIACSSCCTKIKNKCPSCSGSICSNRCRAIEKVLESITTISCQNSRYGCKEPVTYHKKNEHQKVCIYSPCFCPHYGCHFVSSAKLLYRHFSSNHVDVNSSATRFEYSQRFSVTLYDHVNFLILQEKNEGTLFVLMNHCVKDLGNSVTLICIQPSFMQGFFYELYVKTKVSSLKLQSFTKSIPSKLREIDEYGKRPKTGFLLIPCDFMSSGGQLEMQLGILPNGQCPPSFR